MPTIARAHHFVPEFVLAGFTPSGAKDDKLWVVDLRTKKEWTTIPKNVAHHRDLYRVEIPGIEPDFIEQRVLSPIEDRAAKIIREIHEMEWFPEGTEDVHALLLYVALLWCRVPTSRFTVDQIVDLYNRKRMNADLETPEKWQIVLSGMDKMGIDTLGLEYENVKDILGHMNFSATQHFQLRMMFEGAGVILPLLVQRKWSLAKSDSGSFICSDRPVTLTFLSPAPPRTYPGFALSNTEVILPLSRHLLLQGVLEGNRRNGSLNRKGVAHVNSLTLNNAERFIFAPRSSFPWLDEGRIVQLGAELLPRKGSPKFLYNSSLFNVPPI